MGADALVFWLWLLRLFSCRRDGGDGSEEYGSTWPETSPPLGLPMSTPEWPQAVPETVPRFPGSAWEFDEPPPPAVQQRAAQLVNALWAEGSGAHRTERTNGRWITYQAQIVASGKRGVVAYRLRGASTLSPAPAAAAARTDRPVARPTAATSSRPSAPAPKYRVKVGPATIRPEPAPAPAARPAAPAPRSTPAPAPAARPAVAPTSALELPMLRQGRGMPPAAPDPNVRILQQRLGITSDGRFGPGTKRAVVDYQRRRGLQIDGVVGPETWRSLFEVRA